ncbi:hypothetical protein ACG873_07220 [Mesorhizobium sp. AaZ16]|uniref:hypothetical protein n=1 Tax=Mesorhizobium sp. AaZ16 TaxID=3402289 RepID=UPI00374F2C56
MAIFKQKPQASAPTTFCVRTLGEALPEHEVLSKRDAEFVALVCQAEAERVRLLQVDQKSFETEQRKARVASLAEGIGSVDELPEEPKSLMGARFAEINRQTADLRSARDVLREKLTTARMKASAIIVDEVRAEYRTRVYAVCKALIAAFQASRSLEDLKSDLNDKEVAWTSLNPVGVEGLHHRFAHFLQESIRCGFIDAAEVPGALK